jgi:hypothetical protein
MTAGLFGRQLKEGTAITMNCSTIARIILLLNLRQQLFPVV